MALALSRSLSLSLALCLSSVADFGEKIELIGTHATDRASSLKLANAKKGLANEYKRSVGKTLMM